MQTSPVDEEGKTLREPSWSSTSLDVSGLVSVRVANYIRMEIKNGTMKTNDKIDELQVSKLLSVSKTPVREALKILETEGLIKVIPRRGAFVAALDTKTLIEIAVLRANLEGLAIIETLVSETLMDWIQQLRKITIEMRKATSGSQLNELHALFHIALTNSSGNALLNETLRRLQIKVAIFINAIHKLYKSSSEMADQHDEIIDAILREDQSEIRQLIERHILEGLDRLKASGVQTTEFYESQ